MHIPDFLMVCIPGSNVEGTILLTVIAADERNADNLESITLFNAVVVKLVGMGPGNACQEIKSRSRGTS